MRNYNRNLLVVIKNHNNKRAIEKQMDCLNEILAHIESPEEFCLAHELVNRNIITRNRGKILKESHHLHLRPFRFLINRN